MQLIPLSMLPTLRSTSADPTDMVPDRSTYQSHTGPDPTCTEVCCTAALLQPRWLQLILTQLCHSALPPCREPTVNCLLPPTLLVVAR